MILHSNAFLSVEIMKCNGLKWNARQKFSFRIFIVILHAVAHVKSETSDYAYVILSI